MKASTNKARDNVFSFFKEENVLEKNKCNLHYILC